MFLEVSSTHHTPRPHYQLRPPAEHLQQGLKGEEWGSHGLHDPAHLEAATSPVCFLQTQELINLIPLPTHCSVLSLSQEQINVQVLLCRFFLSGKHTARRSRSCLMELSPCPRSRCTGGGGKPPYFREGLALGRRQTLTILSEGVSEPRWEWDRAFRDGRASGCLPNAPSHSSGLARILGPLLFSLLCKSLALSFASILEAASQKVGQRQISFPSILKS